MSRYTVEITDPEGVMQRMIHMPKSFVDAVHEWWQRDPDGLTTIRFTIEEEVIDTLLTHH